MPVISLDEAFGQPTQNPAAKRVSLSDALPDDTAEPVQKALNEQDAVDLVTRSLRHAGFKNVDVAAGLDPDTKQMLEDQRNRISGTVAQDKQITELGREIKANQELLQSAQALMGTEVRSVEDFQREAIENVPRPLRPFATGFAQAGLRSSSVMARLFSAETADALSREGQKLSQIRASLGTSRIEDAMESATVSLTEVLTTAGLGVGVKGVALASGIRQGNEAITEGRDAGLEGLELASFATGQAAIETGLTLIFGKLLGPGLEATGQPIKAAGKAGILNTLKKLGVATLAELPEELTIEILSAYHSAISGVGPELTAQQAGNIAIQTTLTTMLSLGAAQGINAAQERGIRRAEKKAQSTRPDLIPIEGTAPETQTTPKAEVLPAKEDSIRVTKKRLSQLRSEANEDQLTGLGNRRVDKRAVDTLFKRADRTKKPVSLISFDIANFKALNDNLGLQAGDRALQIIADSIQAEIRTERNGRNRDVAGVATRPGGDEFNVLLPSTDKAGAEAVAKRIQARVDAALKEAGIDLPAEGRPVFAAPGVVERSPNDTRTIEELRNEADFAVKAEKKRVKTDLGVPLTRDEAESGVSLAPAETQAAQAASPAQESTAVTPSQLKAEVAALGETVTPSQIKTGKLKARKVVKRKATLAQELKQARAQTSEAKKPKFSPEGFKTVARFARPRLEALKSELFPQASLSDESRKKLLELARTVLPPAERGKLIPAIAKLKTGRQAESMRGRILKAVDTFAQKVEADRLKNEQRQLRRLGKRIPAEIMSIFGSDSITKLRSVDPRNMTAEEAEAAANQIAQIRGLVKELDNLHLGTEKAGINGLATDLVSEMAESAPKERAETEQAGAVSRFFNEGNTKPEELLEGMGKNFVQAFHHALKKGSEVTQRINRAYSETFGKKFDLKKLSKWSRQVAGRKTKTVGVQLQSGKKMTLTLMEAAHVIAAANTPANRAAMLKDGITLRRKMKENRIALTEADLQLIEASAKDVDPDVVAFAAEVKRYLNQDLKPQYDKAFQDLNNYSNVIEDYLPLQRNQQDFLRVPDAADFQQLNSFTLEQIRETKERTNSGASVLIDDLASVVDNHVRRVGMYIGMARPIRNANLVLAHPDVARNMDSRFGTNRRLFLKRRMDQVVQSAVGYRPSSAFSFFNDVTGTLIDNATKGVLGANPAVAFKQLASFVTAATQISAKTLMRGATQAFSRSVEQRMLQHSPQIWTRYQAPRIRLVGQFVDQSNILLDRGGLGEKLMGMITYMDKAVIRSIWRAAEIEVSETTDLAFGTDEYFAAVNTRANEVIDRTQPAFDILDQAGIALEGRTNSLAKLAGAMFMSQRNQNFTMIRRALRKGGKEGLRDLTLVAIVAPAIIASIDWLRREAYGFNEDKTAGQRVAEGLFDVMESNLSSVYGSQVAIDMIQPVKQAVLGQPIQFRGRENVLEASVGRIGRGVQDSVAAVQGIGKEVGQGAKRGKSQASEKLLSALENFTIGVGTLTGVPLSSPVQIVKAMGRQVWTDDYGVMFKERTRLRKLDAAGKLSDFQKEKLAIMEQTFALTNVAQRAAEAGQIDRADANSYIQDQMRGMIQAIEKVEKGVPEQTFSPQEKPKEDELLLREFYTTHGGDLFKFQILAKEANLAKQEFESLRPEDRRAFAKLNPDVMARVRAAGKFSRFNSTLTALRKELTSPATTPARRAEVNTRVKKLLETANDTR